MAIHGISENFVGYKVDEEVFLHLVHFGSVAFDIWTCRLAAKMVI
jgi:hypothetical protein